ncbi:eCIS core domain-containing protein [Streptomyces sp. FR-108]|uniref:eCIS core domain-containing protein n=1 Tax=Streptomyces sp. FR-108 TaxID=3416665 RepID=UPI003CEDC05F
MRIQRENDKGADSAGKRPAARPPTAPHPLIALQQAAGNAAVTRAIQRARNEQRPEGQQNVPEGKETDGRQSAPEEKKADGGQSVPEEKDADSPQTGTRGGTAGHEAEGTAPVQRRPSVRDAVGSPGRPLEPRVLQRAEQAYNMHFGHVRVHNGPVAQRSAADLGALAYTTGSHIVLGGSRVSDEVMYEEVDHVRQQALGPVPGTDNGKGEKVSRPDDAFEQSAGANGRRLARGSAPDLSLPGASLPALPRGAVQRSADGSVPVQRADRPGPVPTAEPPTVAEPSTVAEPPTVATLPAVVRLARLLVGGNQEIRNKEVRAVIHKRVRSGPRFTDEELRTIKAVESEDPKWLKTVGLCTRTEAEAYLKAGKFHDWLEQPEGKRLFVATLRWEQEAENHSAGRPPVEPSRSDYQLGRHMAMHAEDTPKPEKDRLTQERNEQIFQTFVDTMLPPGISDKVPDAAKHRERVARGTELLTKIFLILKEGLKVFNPEAGVHEDFKDDVAHALAYGGRVNIRIPQLADGQHGYELPQWLHITKEDRKFWEPRSTPEKPVYRRGFGTHHMDIGDNQKDGTRGRFVEKGEIGATLQNWLDPHSHLYGLPLALRGMGNKDFHGDTILPNESYGHAFMGYKPPSAKRDGALQVGIETAGPGGRTPDGYEHGLTSSEKNSNPVSQLGGHKDDKIGGKAPLESSQRHVDLREFGDWVQKLKDLEKDWKASLDAARTHEERAALYRDLIGKRSDSAS